MRISIQQRFYNQALKRLIRQSNFRPQAMNLMKASTVGVLLDISSGLSSAVNEAALRFAASLRNLGKTVTVLGFIADTKTPEGLDFDCLCKKDLNWALVPKGPKMESFLKNEYDLLLGLYLGESKPLDFLLLSAKKHLSVGYFQPERSAFFDLMVHNKEQNFEKALQQMQQVLKMINK